ncbi:hypothetical protein BDF22DRAFT_664831 [Syncephalis plumigaleata]|nr:hypothetical protein BDF22DRAFT_664831 [Syncephalis plumigaleata]
MTSPTSATSVMLFNHHHHHHHQHQHATSAQPLSMGDASDSMEAAAFVAAVSVVDSYANTAASRDGSLPPTMAADRAGVLSPTPTPPPPPPHTATFTVSSMASSPSPLALPVSMNNTSDLSTSYPELTPTDSCFKPDVLQALAAVVAKSEATPHLLMTSMPAENHTAEASWMTWPANTPVTLAQLSTFSPVNGKDLSLAELDSMSLF